MKNIVALLLSLFLCFVLTVQVAAAPIKGMTSVVICSPDLRTWFRGHPGFEIDHLEVLDDWHDLDRRLAQYTTLDDVIFLDFAVHGDERGLGLARDKNHYTMATMGYVLNHVQKILGGRHVIVAFECCYAGRVYQKTIRGKWYRTVGDVAEDYPNAVPNFPVYGSGDSFRNIGPIMYVQLKHNFRHWWVDLREYDPLGQNRQLAPIEPYGNGTIENSAAEQLPIILFFEEVK